MKMRSIIAILIIILALGAVGWRRLQTKPSTAQSLKTGDQLVVTTTAKRQDLLISVVQTGAVAARNSTPVIPEISGYIQWVCENGIAVSAGDTLVRLDPTKYQEDLTNLIAHYDEAMRAQAESETVAKSRMTEMRLRLKQAREGVAAYERQQKLTLRELADQIAFDEKELERSKEETEVKKRMAARGLIAGTEVEREEASIKAKEFALQRARSDYELKNSQAEAEVQDRRRDVNNTMRDMSRTRSWTERDVRMSGNEVDNLKLQLERARTDLTKTTLKAPVSGLVVLSTLGAQQTESRLPKMGDYVSQGLEVAQVVSLGRMQVKLELDQKQIAGVKMGQIAEVVIDALAGKIFTGKVTAIGQTARRPPVQGWMGVSSTASFPVTIDLPPMEKTQMRPGMRAGVRIVVRQIKGAVIIPSGCIFQYDNHPIVFAERNGKFLRVPVTPGESNGDYTAITEGLKEGERIALNNLGALPSTETQKKEPRP
jgi:HlyD family secretion protein